MSVVLFVRGRGTTGVENERNCDIVANADICIGREARYAMRYIRCNYTRKAFNFFLSVSLSLYIFVSVERQKHRERERETERGKQIQKQWIDDIPENIHTSKN